MTEQKPPKELDAFVDRVLAYKPKPTSDAGKARKRKAKKAKKTENTVAHAEQP
jgi:hypothetical protein